jgi:hypothetical protein
MTLRPERDAKCGRRRLSLDLGRPFSGWLIYVE